MLKVENLTIVKQDKVILNNCDLKIRNGEKVLIFGDSGSGKSTLLKAILFFEHHSGGTVYFKGEKIDRQNIDSFRKNFVYISQKAPSFEGSVQEYLCLPFTFKHNQHNIPTDLKKYLHKLNFPDSILKQKYDKLSGGEQQRITILQSLLLDKSFFLLDEITSSLDENNINQVVKLIISDPQRSIISISHNKEWLDCVDTIYLMNNGKLQKKE
jgi:putative ABC transport system ATP-binding protein